MASASDLVARMDALCAGMETAVRSRSEALDRIPAERRASAENLLHYLHLRSRDLRELQEALSAYGLSSLGRCEGAVLAHCRRVRAAAASITQGEPWAETDRAVLLTNRRLESAAHELFGSATPRIMVTLAADDANDAVRLDRLVRAGMSVARINAGHDDAATWSRLIACVRASAKRTGMPCRVLLDLPGLKLRVGDLPSLPGQVHLRPERDRARVVTTAAQCRLRFADGTGSGLPLVGIAADQVQVGDRLRLHDTRGRKRLLRIVADDEGELNVSTRKNVYIAEGTVVSLCRKGRRIARGTVNGLPPAPLVIPIEKGTSILLVKPESRGVGTFSSRTNLWRVPCTHPAILKQLRVGHRIRFNDGRFGGTVDAIGSGWVRLRFDSVPGGHAKLKADQGINCIDVHVEAPDLVAEDATIIDAFASQVDLLGLSFVQSPAQVRAVQERCAAVGARPGLVAKIETPSGFTAMPEILLEGLAGGPFAVLIARGDLAVEAGFARMAEIQEELLWLCEAAHVPAIWGTQVLEKLAKKGLPTRAEVTDAAMSSRAECVMLNKGAYVEEAVRFLVDVVPRIRDHVVKKRALLRRLNVADSPGLAVSAG